MKKLLLALSAATLLALTLTSCFTTSRSFVEDRTGVSVIKGRIVQVENLSASNIRRFNDGLAVTVNKPGCKVSMSFTETETKVMELAPGSIIVYGASIDYILRSAPGMPAR